MQEQAIIEHPPVWHQRMFDEFVRNELAIGGPDPHMRYVGYCVFPHGWPEIIWRLGVYISVYNFATAEVIWQHWSAERMERESDQLEGWIAEHWNGLKLRRERRAVRTVKKLTRCLTTYAKWSREYLPMVLREFRVDKPEWNYELLWKMADKGLYGFGRYAMFKLLETYRRYADIDILMPDVRPRGGYSPRMTLNMLDGQNLDPHLDKPEMLKRVNAQAEKARAGLKDRTGLDLDRYRFEVMLCDYRQSYEGERQYPGRSLDSEIGYYYSIRDYWGADRPTQLWEARKAATHPEGHGELRGWKATRDELGTVLRRAGYTWSDMVYEYRPDSVLQPVRRDDAKTEHQLTVMAMETLESRW